jgi:flavodoxin
MRNFEMKIKNVISLLIIAITTMLFTGCDEAAQNQPENNAAEQNSIPNQNVNPAGERILVVYFTRSGNTEKLTNMITDFITADVFVIEPVEPYTDTYQATIATADKERRENARPEYIGGVENMDEYDIILLGYPIWGGRLPMIVHTFLEDYDLTGKTIYPFWSSNHGGYFNTINILESALPNSKIGEGLSVRGSEVAGAQEGIKDWLLNIGMLGE